MNSQQLLQALEPYVPLFQTFLTVFLLLIVVLILRRRTVSLLITLEERIRKGSSIKLGGMVELGEENFVTETDDLKAGEVQVFGNPDRLKLLFKAQSDTWSKSTKAMEVPGGCVVQVSSEQLNLDGSWNIAEALTFVPNVRVVLEDPTDPEAGRYLDRVIADET